MSLEDWYRLLNGKVFFWVARDRLTTLQGAKACRDWMQTVITVDTELLIRRYLARVTLSPINSGSTLDKPVRRGPQTFLPLSDYPFRDSKRQRGRSRAVAELAVDYSAADIIDLTIRVENMQHGKSFEVLYER